MPYHLHMIAFELPNKNTQFKNIVLIFYTGKSLQKLSIIAAKFNYVN